MHCPSCSPTFEKASGPNWTSYHADARRVLPTLAAESVDGLVSDPPYAAGATSLMGRLASTSTKYRSTGASKLPDFDGDSMLPEAWQELMAGVLSQAHRVLKPGAPVILFCDWRSLPALQALVGAHGFSLKGVAVWDKGRGSRPKPNGFRSQSELIVWAEKPGKLERVDPPVYLDGVLKFNTISRNKLHLTQKPVPLMEELIRLVPAGGLVLDPFQGSGTTGVAALRTGRQYIGIESTAAYHARAAERLAVEGFSLPAPVAQLELRTKVSEFGHAIHFAA